jgi:hypothetical protein
MRSLVIRVATDEWSVASNTSNDSNCAAWEDQRKNISCLQKERQTQVPWYASMLQNVVRSLSRKHIHKHSWFPILHHTVASWRVHYLMLEE